MIHLKIVVYESHCCYLDLIDDLCSNLPADVFSNSPAAASQQLGSRVGGNGIETHHPNLTGLLTNSNHGVESQQVTTHRQKTSVTLSAC